MAVIEETLQIGASLKSYKSKRAISKSRMFALGDKQGNIMHNMDEIIKVGEKLFTRLYGSDVRTGETTELASLTGSVPLVAKEKAGKALKGMKRGTAAGDDDITVDLLKDRGDIGREQSAVLFSECLRT